MMRTLLIAPATNLPGQADEARAVGLALSAAALTGTLTRSDLQAAVVSQRWDCLWFATHGSSNGVQLSDNLLSASDLIQLVRNSGATLLYLNTCDAEIVGLYLHHELNIDVICTIGPIEDATATATGMLLARNLAAGLSVQEAYARSVPGDVGGAQRFRLFHNGSQNDNSDMRLMQMLSLMLDRLDRRISQVERDLSNDIEQVRDSVDRLSREMRDQFHPRLGRQHGQLWLFGAILAGVVPLFLLPQLDDLLDLSVASQLILILLCEVAAVAMLAHALRFDWRRR